VSSTVAAVPVFMLPYIDVRLVSSSGGEINDAALQSFAASGATLQRRGDANPVARVQTDTQTGRKSWISLGDGKVRMFFEPDRVVAGIYDLTLAATGTWQDSAGAVSDREVDFRFTLVDPQAEVVSPFNANRPGVDVHVANTIAGNTYIDVIFRPTPGAGLDYASILDAGQEFTLTGLSGITAARPARWKSSSTTTGWPAAWC
jgi:hypothetical protein